MRLPRTPKSGNGHDERGADRNDRNSARGDALSPEIERELDAVDRALAGADPSELEAELADLATLTAEIRKERPDVDAEWAAELDRRAGEGFGSSSRWSLSDLGERVFRGRRPAQVLLPAGALATAAVVIGIGVAGNVGSDESGDGDTGGLLNSISTPTRDDAGDGPAAAAPEAVQPDEWEALEQQDLGLTADDATSSIAPPLPPGSDRTARGQQKRQQDRNASLILETGTKRVREVSDQAIQITESAGGVVISANLTEGEKRASAILDLQIPTRELDVTLDRLTDLANVKSLNESSVDITKPFVTTQDLLKDARAERRELLKALGNASTEAEAEALRRQLKDARKQISRAQARFENIARLARLSTVFVEIQGRSGLDESDSGFSLGDAADDALNALKTVAGVMLIAAAIIAPLAILGGVIWLIAGAVRRKRREAALDED